MRKFLRRLFDRLVYGASSGSELDHVPVGPEFDPEDPFRSQKWQARALAIARDRHGRAFKCAGQDQDREVLTWPGQPAQVIQAHQVPKHGPTPERLREMQRGPIIAAPSGAELEKLRREWPRLARGLRA